MSRNCRVKRWHGFRELVNLGQFEVE
jgi:hypothetical protein